MLFSNLQIDREKGHTLPEGVIEDRPTVYTFDFLTTQSVPIIRARFLLKNCHKQQRHEYADSSTALPGLGDVDVHYGSCKRSLAER